MTTVRDRVAARAAESAVLEALPSDLPAVERRAAIPDGFRAAAGIAGIKASGRPDVALIVRRGKETFPAAAVFTPNRFAAAPVRRSRLNLLATEPGGNGGFGYADAVVCTSGCANAATGAAGDADQAEVGRMVHEATGAHEDRVLHLSTGLIGTRLPLDRVGPAIAALAPSLASTDEALLAAAEAFRTTDSVVKVATASVDLPAPGGRGRSAVPVRVTGIAKGVGMIHPTMATMLSVLVTDAGASPRLLWEVLRQATARTWNQLTVDGDTSTNDTVFLLGSGAAGVIVDERTRAAFAGAVEAVARDLARQQAADGEGATALITCQVSGAVDDAEARAVARVVVSSSLVKTAVHGRDPNWGRIAGAAGNAALARAAVLEAAGLPAPEARERGGSAAQVDPDKLRIAIAGHLVYDGPSGGPIEFDREAARRDMAGKEVLLRLDLGLGDGRGEAFGCDLTEAYVIENSEYTT
ncbi:MAG TPA: bifunctional ornithine acetyltransferase/N-acetylglutamate synthase [Candidatus Limnocylindrales bacterium]|jgi:glutamate N-acetyltransferase/amino-acid N-acetyltransferase|nr:bifunctional ornithine acetyltransferase/N-acetylglutamate synthase [Candidatus Limnocylindrales bacterium]